MTLMEQLSAYVPYNEQEARDRALLWSASGASPEVLTRQNPLAHFTASAWIVNPARTRVLMAYHNIYHSWSWLGGHADGESDLLAVALREAREESGIRSARRSWRISSAWRRSPWMGMRSAGRMSPHTCTNTRSSVPIFWRRTRRRP